VRDIETIGCELRLVAALRAAARERGGPLPSIEVADTLLDNARARRGVDLDAVALCELAANALAAADELETV
jgi:hypothetical protein